MTKKENEKILRMLEDSAKRYEDIKSREDYPEKLCVERWARAAQNTTFALADYLYHYGFISWEQCCKYWSRVDILDEEDDAVCGFDSCEANIDGKCKYYGKGGG